MTRSTLRFAPLLAAMISLLVALVPAASTASDGGPDLSDRGATDVDSPIDPPREVQPLETFNDLLARVSEQVPEFGGAWVEGDSYVGEDEVLHLWLTDPSDEAARQSQRLLVEIVGERFEQDEIRLHEADYTWSELLDWFYEASEIAMPHRAYIGIREQANRIVIGTEAPELYGSVLEDLGEHAGIPKNAIVIEEAQTPVPLLDDRRRPLVGGTEIRWRVGFITDSPPCSLGFPSHWGSPEPGGHPGFVTASHCSRVPGEVDGHPGNDYWQPSRPFFGGDVAGFELIDPAYNPNLPGCPQGDSCRYSDAAYVERNFNENVPVDRGRVAYWFFSNTLETDWDDWSKWRMTANELPMLGTQVLKVGRTTGQTSGTVTDTCMTTEPGLGRAYLCQARVEMHTPALRGDSGGPVFRGTRYPDTRDGWATGIVSVGERIEAESGFDIMYLSAIDYVKSELGGGDTSLLRVCDPDWSC